MKKNIMFEVQDVYKIYEMKGVETHALRGATLKIKKGEYVAILGASGSGKSTLMHIMGCLDTPTKGRVFVEGREISEMNDDELAKIRREMIGFIFQAYNLIPGLTAAENVALPMRLAGHGRGESQKKAKELLRRVGLGDRMKHKPNEPIVFIGNHWPARLGGVYETEPYRILAAETLSYYIKRIMEIHGKHTPIIIMGDFNDTPNNRSLVDYALSSRNKNVVKYSTTDAPGIYNLMWPLMTGEYGTFWYSEPLFLDQFLVSKGLLVSKRRFSVETNSVNVIKEPKMWKKDPSKARYPVPRDFGWSVKDPPGYSDHFPIVMTIME